MPPIATEIERQFPLLPPVQVTQLSSFVLDGIQFADLVNRTGNDQPIPLNQIPENPVLFGDESFSDRFSFDVDVGFGDSAGETFRWLGIQVRSPTELSFREIVDMAREEALRRINESPAILQGRDANEIVILDPEIIFLERRF